MASCVAFLLVAVFVVMVSTVLADPAPQAMRFFGVFRVPVRGGPPRSVANGRGGESDHVHGQKTSGGHNNGAQPVGEGVKHNNPSPSVLHKGIDAARPKGQERSGSDGLDPSLAMDGGATGATSKPEIY